VSREAFLQRVRQAVAEGNRAGGAPPLPTRGDIGYQGAGDNPVERFRIELLAAGGALHVVPNVAAAADKVLELVTAKSARQVLLGRGAVLDRLGVAERLRALGAETALVDSLAENEVRSTFFAAEIGISGVAYLIAETGTVVVRTAADEPRSLSLLPPVHIAVADRSQLLPDLFDLFTILERERSSVLPSCVTLITGPSKTGDIELKLVTGVHGPGEVHVVLIDS
jgi:L-lactate dehydrogenase complex protein LldG